MSALRFTVTRTAADYRSAILAAWINRGDWKWIGLPGVVAASFVFVTGLRDQSPTVLSDSAAMGIVVVLIGLICVAASLLLTAARASRIPGALDPISYAFSEEGVEVETSTGKGSTKWQAFKQAVETRGHLILLSIGGNAHILPKRDLAPDEQMRLRILLNDALGGPRIAFLDYRA